MAQAQAQKRQMGVYDVAEEQALPWQRGQQFYVPQQQRLPYRISLGPCVMPSVLLLAEDVDNHFKTITRAWADGVEDRDICLPILDEVLKEKYAYGVFGNPVDPVALGLTDYAEMPGHGHDPQAGPAQLPRLGGVRLT